MCVKINLLKIDSRKVRNSDETIIYIWSRRVKVKVKIKIETTLALCLALVLQFLTLPETTQINCMCTLMSYALKVMRVFTPLSRNFTRSVKNNHRQRSLLNQTSPISYLALSHYSHNNTSLLQSTNLKTSTCVVSNNYTINKNNKCSFSSQHYSHNSHSLNKDIFNLLLD